MRGVGWSLIASLVLLGGPALAQGEGDLPVGVSDVRFDQRLGEPVPLDARFRDEDGRAVTLGALLQARPVVLALVYYDCPMICNMVLNGLAHALRPLKFDVGREFDVVVVSFDPRETPELAAAKKVNYMREYARPGTEEGWHFLTGDATEIRRLTDAVGFHYTFDEETGEFAHATGVLVLTPAGRIARLLYGIDYPPKDLRLALVEAADEKIGSVVDQVLLYCFRYDPTTGRYGAAVINIIRLAGVLTVGGMVGFWVLMWRRSRAGSMAGGAV